MGDEGLKAARGRSMTLEDKLRPKNAVAVSASTGKYGGGNTATNWGDNAIPDNLGHGEGSTNDYQSASGKQQSDPDLNRLVGNTTGSHPEDSRVGDCDRRYPSPSYRHERTHPAENGCKLFHMKPSKMECADTQP